MTEVGPSASPPASAGSSGSSRRGRASPRAGVGRHHGGPGVRAGGDPDRPRHRRGARRRGRPRARRPLRGADAVAPVHSTSSVPIRDASASGCRARPSAARWRRIPTAWPPPRPPAALLESVGHVVEPTHVAALDPPEFVEAFLLVWAAGTAYDVDHYWPGKLGRRHHPGRGRAPDVGARRRRSGRRARRTSSTARRQLQAIARQVAQWYEGGFDLLLTPTIAEPPPLIGEFDSPPDNPLHGLFRAAEVVPFTPPFNATGQPAISLPLHWNAQGLPIGVQLVAPYGREDVLLRVAAQLEEAAPWAQRRPPVSRVTEHRSPVVAHQLLDPRRLAHRRRGGRMPACTA